MMQSFDNLTDARNAIMDFRADHSADIPKHILPRFRELTASPSPVEQICMVGELIWANRDQLTAPAWELGASLLQYATTNAFYGLQDDDRGFKIVANLRKDVGEIKSAPAAPGMFAGSRIDPPGESDAPPPVQTA